MLRPKSGKQRLLGSLLALSVAWTLALAGAHAHGIAPQPDGPELVESTETSAAQACWSCVLAQSPAATGEASAGIAPPPPEEARPHTPETLTSAAPTRAIFSRGPPSTL